VLDLDNSTSAAILVKQYVIVALYFATNGEGWVTQGNFLSASLVCEWNNWQYRYLNGAGCNQDDLVVELDLGKSTNEEAIVLISKFHIDSPISLPLYLNRF
jgi:hypothetical protein